MNTGGADVRIAGLFRDLDVVKVSGEMTAFEQAKASAALDALALQAGGLISPSDPSADSAETHDDIARLYRRLAQANTWLIGREAKTREWLDHAERAAASDVLRDMIVAERNALLDAEAFPGIAELCQKGLVDKARRVLATRRRSTRDPLVRKRIDDFIRDPRNLLAPITSAPGLFTYNGFGTGLWGERSRTIDGTHVTTLCLVFLFLPFFPLASYLARREGEGWRFYGRVPLSPFAFWYRRVAVLVPVVMAVLGGGWNLWNSSDVVRENRLLAEAERLLNSGDPAAAIQRLAMMSTSAHSGRIKRGNALAGSAFKSLLLEVRRPEDGMRFLARGLPGHVLRGPMEGDPGMKAVADMALDRLAGGGCVGAVTRDFIAWRGQASQDPVAHMADLAARACGTCDDPVLLAAAAGWHRAADRPCPESILSRLKMRLLQERHDTWEVDALEYLRSAPPDPADAVLLVRAEAAWKGRTSGAALLELPSIPAMLRAILELDAESDLAKRAAGLESIAGAEGLDGPQKVWHRLGVARRLSLAYSRLNEQNPTLHPMSKGRPWAIEAAELAPDDIESRVTALRYLVEDGDFARAITLGEGGVGDIRTGLLVGIACARSGQLEKAGDILRPLVRRDLETFTSAYLEWEKAYGERTRALWTSLQTGLGDRALIARLNALPPDQAGAEAEAWVRRHAEMEPRVSVPGATWRSLTDVHAAAGELAMVELALGRSLPPGPNRDSRLKESERLFLELRKIQADDPHQELQLGQVYFWMGREKEGAAIFDRLETDADAELLHQMGEIYRTLSRMESARRVLEKAYEKADAQAKAVIAATRMHAASSEEDKFDWLQKTDTSTARGRADVDQMIAERAMHKGAWAEAVEPLQRAVAYYAGLPEDSVSCNNAGILQLYLAQATGDLAHQGEALRLLKRSHEFSPENGIVLGNYIELMEEAGYAALASGALRSDLLHALPNREWLDYVTPQPTSEEWRERAKRQPELRRAAELCERAAVLSPDRESGYAVRARYYTLTHDGAALRRLREGLEGQPPIRREAAALEQAHALGRYTPEERSATERNLARLDDLVSAIRQADHAPTLGYVLSQRAEARIGAFMMGLPGASLETAEQDATDAVAAFDAHPTRHTLAWVLMEQASLGAAAADEGFAQWRSAYPGMNGALLMSLYVRKHPDRAAAIRQRDDVRRAADAVAELERLPVRQPWLMGWAWLDLSGHAGRDASRTSFLDDPTAMERVRLDRRVTPGAPVKEAWAWLAAELSGDRESAARIREAAVATGALPLLFGE
jgi:tetratricopeptide (TPR) repeat protein